VLHIKAFKFKVFKRLELRDAIGVFGGFFEVLAPLKIAGKSVNF